MKLVILRSDDAQAWVDEIVSLLRSVCEYTVEIDTTQSTGGEVWWSAVCRNIEQAECVLLALTPESADSIYCKAQLEYALALNKPILPLMVKLAGLPDSIVANNIQVENVRALSADRALLRCVIALGEIRLRLKDGVHILPSPFPARPPLPAAPTAEPFTEEQLANLRYQQERAQAYRAIERLMGHPGLHKGTESLWKVYVNKYSTVYDPHGYQHKLPTPPHMAAVYRLTGREADKQEARAYLERALERAEADYPGKIADCSEAIRLDPRCIEAYVDRGVAYHAQEQYDRALADFNEAIRLDPQHVVAHNKRGNVYYAQQQYTLAVADYTEGIRLDSQDYTPLFNRGEVYRNQGEFALALEDYTAAIRLVPQDADAYNNRGLIYKAQDHLDLAVADYTEAIRLAPQSSAAYHNRGWIYESRGEFDLAIADYTEAIRLDPAYADTHHLRGNVYQAQDQIDLAIADYTEAIRLDPTHRNAYYQRGHLYMYKKNDHLHTLADFDAAIRLNPTEQTAYLHRAAAYISKSRVAFALADLSEAIRLDPEFMTAYYLRGYLHDDRNNHRAAARDYQRVLELSPDHESAEKLRAYIQEHAEKRGE